MTDGEARREALEDDLRRARARLEELDAHRDEAARVVERLAAQLEDVQSRSERPPSSSNPDRAPRLLPTAAATVRRQSSPEDKLRLFAALFRGRPDVHPRLWVNARTGRKGYAPACDNEWVRGTCEKPRVRCGECPHQAFVAVSDRALLDHLQGRHVMGVYPLLGDDTCWFLAADFDKAAWRDDVSAFRKTCRAHGVPVAVERSRSGNGAHAWIFFAAPVAAAAARRMGCFLITETMASRPELSMSSYDRLFPSQDVLPRGGFGNLIALPLQHASRKEGNTVFLDDDLTPHDDQWAFLASVTRMEASAVEALAGAAARRGLVLGLPSMSGARGMDSAEQDAPLFAPGFEGVAESSAPWHPAAPRTAAIPSAGDPLPAEVRAVLARRVVVAVVGLPSWAVNAILRLAAFQNPEFYRRQGLRLSTARTPRVISCAEHLGEHVALPRGCLAALQQFVAEHGSRLVLSDERQEGTAISASFRGTLSPSQDDAVSALLEHDTGTFVAPPGSGKTVVAAAVIARRGRSTLVLVHRRPLLEQWRERLASFLDGPEEGIGTIGGGRRAPTGAIDVVMIQSLVRKGAVSDLVGGYGQVVVDECHHVPAVSFERILSEAPARFVLGLTATPQRRDGHHPIMAMQLGPVRHRLDPRAQARGRPFEHRVVVRETAFVPPSGTPDRIQSLHAALAADAARNARIVDDVIAALERGRSPLVLTERRDHLDHFANVLAGAVRNLVVLRGGETPKRRAAALKRLADVPVGEERLVLATGRYVGEGFDDARLDTLFLTAPFSWKGTLVQYAGRLHRAHAGKADVIVFDYVDRQVPMLARMAAKRMSGYRSLGYQLASLPADWTAAGTDPVVELDEGVEDHSADEW